MVIAEKRECWCTARLLRKLTRALRIIAVSIETRTKRVPFRIQAPSLIRMLYNALGLLSWRMSTRAVSDVLTLLVACLP